jgi:CO/xanthine dehydrogenase Mo-binding subunit
MQLVANSLFNRVAAYLEMDPTELALKNNGSEGETWEELQEWREEHWLMPNRNSLKECIDIAKEKMDWDNKWHAPGTKILPNGRYHGLGFLWAHEWTLRKWSSSAGISVARDGTISILGSFTNVGQGGWTCNSQIVADEIGMKYEDVEHRSVDDHSGYFMGLIGGSAGTMSNSPTLVRCARKAKQMILELACQPDLTDYFLPSIQAPTPSFPKEGSPAAFR